MILSSTIFPSPTVLFLSDSLEEPNNDCAFINTEGPSTSSAAYIDYLQNEY